MSKPVIIDMVVIEADRSALPDLAQKINAAAAAAEANARSAMDHALVAGRLLNDAKCHIEHGAWEGWLTANCTLAPRTARAYMRLATKLPLLPDAERQRIADLPIRQAISAIATNPEAPPRQQGVRIAARTDAERAAVTFRDAAKTLHKGVMWVGLRRLNARHVQELRTKLANAIAELDRLTTGEVQP